MLKAKDIMTRDVITVKPTTSIEDLARLLMRHQINGTPMVDDNGNLTGIVTENDLISKNSRLHIPTILRLFDAFIPLGTTKLEVEIKKMAAYTVGDICIRDVITVNDETSVEDIATIMTEKKINLLPVLREGKLIGIVGKKDIIRGMAGEPPG
ncbi:MAG: CBS domain-containing protein [Nitrospirota bacterium]|nr:CBS domain-containing protein [Nitrospirota bacterium]